MIASQSKKSFDFPLGINGESIHKNASNSNPYVVPSGKFLIIYTVNLNPGTGGSLVANNLILSTAALNYGGPGGTAIKSPFVFEENTELKEILVFTEFYMIIMVKFNQ